MAKVLIIDDDKAVADFVAEALLGGGHQAAAVPGVAAGEALVASEPFDAIVLEMILSPLDGVEAIPRLRALRPHCPIIAMTAWGRVSAHNILAVAMALGAQATLPKPFSASDLLTAVDAALEAKTRDGERRLAKGGQV